MGHRRVRATVRPGVGRTKPCQGSRAGCVLQRTVIETGVCTKSSGARVRILENALVCLVPIAADPDADLQGYTQRGGTHHEGGEALAHRVDCAFIDF